MQKPLLGVLLRYSLFTPLHTAVCVSCLLLAKSGIRSPVNKKSFMNSGLTSVLFPK